MGFGYLYKCKNCNYRYSVSLGIGMMYSSVLSDITQKVKNGDYGDKWQEIINSNPDKEIDIGLELYTCSCGAWKNDYNMAIIEPIDQIEYKVIKPYIHICDDCGKRMKKVSANHINSLACPKCKTINETRNFMNWD